MTNLAVHAALAVMYSLTFLFFCLLFIKTRKIIRLAAKLKAENIAAQSDPASPAAVTAIDLDIIYSEILRLQDRLDFPRRDEGQNIAVSASIRQSEFQQLEAVPNIRLRRVK